MKPHLLKFARRPVPSGRMAESASVLPARDCFTRRIESEWFAVHGFPVPVQCARPGSPPTAGNNRIGVDATTGTESKSQRSRNFRATSTRYSRNDHRCVCYLHGLSAFANFPRSFHGPGLSTVFPQSRTVSIHVPSATTIQPRSVHCLSQERPSSDEWFPHLQYARCLNCFVSIHVFEWSSPLARVVCVRAFRSPVVAYQSSSVRWVVLFAFRMALLASAKARLNLSGGVVLSVVAGLLFRHSGRRAGLHFVSFARSSGIHLLAVVRPWLVCPLRQRRSVAVIQRVPTITQSESALE